MRLKYYLRGVGIGIVVTTIIFMISISLHKNEIEPQNAAAENDKSTTVSEAEKNVKETETAGTETEQADTGKTDSPDTQTADKPDANKSDADKPDTNKSDTDKPDTNKSDADKPDTNKSDTKKPDASKTDAAESGQQPSDTETKTKDKKTEKVRFEIKGGEFSDTICQKLKTAGLIDDAKAFNNFLIEKDYDNGILPGVYDIPKDATYEEIAALLTTKVE